MRLGQIRWNNQVTAAIFNGEGARPIPDNTLYDLLVRAETEKVPLPALALEEASSQHVPAPPIIPIHPREVWACGCTYQRNVAFRDADREGLHCDVYKSSRPEIFFKGTARVCVGLNKNIGIRQDSNFTVPEAELAVVLGKNGQVVGYTLANDVTAIDIERQSPLYLAQSKIFTGCCALGPVIVTPDGLADPYNLEMTCAVIRGGETVFTGSVNTSWLSRKVEHLAEFLLRSNPVPSGSVLLTGNGIIPSEESRLEPGDVVSIKVPEIGELTNTVVQI
jgi:2-dehydro-3-deoxy-D-arabinonate dehydratase